VKKKTSSKIEWSHLVSLCAFYYFSSKNMLRIFTCALVLAVFFPELKASNWRHNQIGNLDGLSNSAVTSSFLDSKGYMWFGTCDGLNRFGEAKIISEIVFKLSLKYQQHITRLFKRKVEITPLEYKNSQYRCF